MRLLNFLSMTTLVVLASACVKIDGTSQQSGEEDGDTGSILTAYGSGNGGGTPTVPPGPNALDKSFGAGTGKTMIAPSNGKDIAQAMILQSDRKPVVLGSCHVSTTASDAGAIDLDVCALRFATDGSSDTTFGTNGIQRYRLGTSDDTAAALVVQSDDSLFAAATRGANADADMAVLRLQKNGALNTTWGSGGAAIVNYANNRASHARGLAVDSTGRAIVAGFTFADGNVSTAAIARLTPNGSGVDTTFGVGGNPQYQVGLGNLRVNFATGLGQGFSAVTLDSSGRIVAAGYLQQSGHRDAVVARFTASGVLDTTFGTNGFVVMNSQGTQDDEARAVRVDALGRIVVGGIIRLGNNADFAAFRLLDSGAMDTTFASGGWNRFDVTTDDSLADMVVASDSRIYLVGNGTTAGVDRPIFLRIGPGGQLEKKLTPFPTWNQAATYAAAVMPDAGTMLVIGTFYAGASQFDLFLSKFKR